MALGILIVVTLVAVPVIWFLLPFGLRRLQTRRLNDMCRQANAIALTYDDGPSPNMTRALIDLLAEENVPATFFVLGANATAQPDIIETLRQKDHEIANHTQDHSNAWKTVPWVSNQDIRTGQKTLRGLGIETDLLRPTYGKTTLASLWLGLWTGLRFAYWTVDTRDSWDRRPVGDVIDELKAKGGGVVLMHDFELPNRGPSPDQHVQYVLDTTRAIIKYARENGMTLCRFSDLPPAPERKEAVS